MILNCTNISSRINQGADKFGSYLEIVDGEGNRIGIARPGDTINMIFANGLEVKGRVDLCKDSRGLTLS